MNPVEKTWLSKHRDVLICLCLIAATLAVYGQVGTHEFVCYDDDDYVTENHTIQSGLTSENIAYIFTSTVIGYWQPMTLLSHTLDCELFGLDAGRHHFTNAFFHVLNTLVLFVILKRMTGAPWRSGFVAVLFAIHPLHVESVAWISERKDVLSTFFWMLTIWSYVRYVERPSPTRYVPIIVFFMLGLMAKPMLVTLPFVLLLLDYWPLGRLTLEHPENSRRRYLNFRLLWEKAPIFAVAAAACVVTLLFQQRAGQVGSSAVYPLEVRLGNAVFSYMAYIWKMIWPFRLAAYYPHPGPLPWWQVAGTGFLLALISVLALRDIGRRPYFTMGWFWYIGILVPVIGIVQVASQAMADHFTYVPLIGIFIIIAWGVPELVPQGRFSKAALYMSAAAIIGFYMVAAWFQVSYWKNSTVLFRHAIESTSGNFIAHNNLGHILINSGNMEEGAKHCREAIRIMPDYADAHYNLGIVLAEQGKIEDAIHHYNEALRIEPDSVQAHNNLGVALASQGKYEEAIHHYDEVLRIRPDLFRTHNNMGVALASQGKFEKAIQKYKHALLIMPDYAKARNNLVVAHYRRGTALASQGKHEEAIHHYNEVLRINPDFAQARAGLTALQVKQVPTKEVVARTAPPSKDNSKSPALYYQTGNIYQGRGELDRAMEQYKKALSIRPDYAPAMNNLALIYGIQGDYDKALSLYMKIIGLQPDAYIPYYNIACIYSKQNRTEESVEWLKKALEKGFNDWNLLEADKDLENIRNSSYYKELISDSVIE